MNLVSAFLRDWRATGSIMPSSRFLQEGMMARLDFDHIKLAVELGPGTGVITSAILNRLSPEGKLVAVEINETFVDRLRQNVTDARLLPIHGSATDLPALLRDRGLGQADCVVSGIPFANLPIELRDEIVGAAVKALAPGGIFVAFQYAPLALPPVLKQHFPQYRTNFVLLNVPPALVYSCQKN